MTQDTGHCVIGDDNNLLCQRCQQQHKVPFPMPIKDFSKAVDAFTTLHSYCKPGANANG